MNLILLNYWLCVDLLKITSKIIWLEFIFLQYSSYSTGKVRYFGTILKLMCANRIKNYHHHQSSFHNIWYFLRNLIIIIHKCCICIKHKSVDPVYIWSSSSGYWCCCWCCCTWGCCWCWIWSLGIPLCPHSDLLFMMLIVGSRLAFWILRPSMMNLSKLNFTPPLITFDLNSGSPPGCTLALCL